MSRTDTGPAQDRADADASRQRRLSRARMELASLRVQIERIESGEQLVRLQRILDDISSYPHQNEADVRNRIAELSSPAGVADLLRVLRDQEAVLARKVAALEQPPKAPQEAKPATIRTRDRAEEVLPVADTRSPDSTLERIGLFEAFGRAFGALAATVVFWVICVIVLSIVSDPDSRVFDEHSWLNGPFQAALLCAFATAVAIQLERHASALWASVVAVVAGAPLVFGPTRIWLPALGAALVLPAFAIWLVGRRGRSARGRGVDKVIAGLAWASIGLMAVPVAGAALYPEGRESTASASSFCDTHACIASFDQGSGSTVQCADGMWSHSGGRPGACSYHGGVSGGDSVAPTRAIGTSVRTASPVRRATPRRTPQPAPAWTPTPRPATTPAGLASSAKRTVAHYYAAIDAGEFPSAWRRLAPSLRGTMGAYETWKAGYDTTVSQSLSNVSSTLVNSETASVTFTLHASDVDVCGDDVTRRFGVTWSLTRSNGRWVAVSIVARRLSGRTPATDETECETSPSTSSGTSGFDVCEYSRCTEDFHEGTGSIVACSDGTLSHSGGIQGACSHHGGVSGGTAPTTTPSIPSSGKTVHVDGYFRKDGTYVRPHFRRPPCSVC